MSLYELLLIRVIMWTGDWECDTVIPKYTRSFMEIANEYTHYSKHTICELYKIDNANYNTKVLNATNEKHNLTEQLKT